MDNNTARVLTALIICATIAVGLYLLVDGAIKIVHEVTSSKREWWESALETAAVCLVGPSGLFWWLSRRRRR